MPKEKKVYQVVRIEHGFVEGTSKKKANKLLKKEGFTVTFSEEILIKEPTRNLVNKAILKLDFDRLRADYTQLLMINEND